MKIGPHSLRTPLVLAPMAAVSELPFRRIALGMGAGLAPTELVSAEGLVRNSARTLRYLRRDASVERPFCVQLFGGDPGRVAEGAKVARDHGAEVVDLNMGCPVPKVTRGGGGAALMADPARAAAMVAAVAKATGLPVTVKIRSGWDASSINAPAFAAALEQAGAAAVAVHARTRAQGYSGHADWQVIAQVKRAVAIPVVGNGDVAGRADAERMVAETGCDAVMVGRAALGNPWVFRQILGGPAPTCEERAAMVRRHFDEHLDHWGEPSAGVRSFRRLLLWYARGLRGAARFRVEATGLEEPDAVREAVAAFFPGAEAEGTAADEPAL